MTPELVYYALVFGIALPLSWRDPLARVVFVAWAVWKISYEAGLPEPATESLVFWSAGCVGGVAAYRTKSAANQFAAIMFFPMFLSGVLWGFGLISELESWWTVYWLGMAQVLSLPFNIGWRSLWRKWRAAHKGGGMGMHQFVRA